jgi:hypothetical protein
MAKAKTPAPTETPDTLALAADAYYQEVYAPWVREQQISEDEARKKSLAAVSSTAETPAA